MQTTRADPCSALRPGILPVLALALLAACGVFRTECDRYETRPVQVSYCAVFRSGYCQSTGYRTQMQSVCVSGRCRSGYISYRDDCLTIEEYNEAKRRDATLAPERDAGPPVTRS